MSDTTSKTPLIDRQIIKKKKNKLNNLNDWLMFFKSIIYTDKHKNINILRLLDPDKAHKTNNETCKW